jgi:hypothetical protein
MPETYYERLKQAAQQAADKLNEKVTSASESAGQSVKAYTDQSEAARKAVEFLKSLKKADSGDIKVPEPIWQGAYKTYPVQETQRRINSYKKDHNLEGDPGAVDFPDTNAIDGFSLSDSPLPPDYVAPAIDSTLPPPRPPPIEPDWDALYPTPVAPAPHPLPEVKERAPAPVPQYTHEDWPTAKDPNYDSIYEEVNRRTPSSGPKRRR